MYIQKRICLGKSFYKLFQRYYWQSNDVRSAFFTFFKERDHQFAPPSPVNPLGDNSLTFVNAGMNQFKSVFLGLEEPCYRKAYNSQKCIRVGGKHNDLSDVGNDTFHHTFFEMLGNWSFGDYFKEESCTLAWHLLTKIYKISPRNLFVTYFGGDDELKLMPDTETRDIWLRIGVPENRVLPFGCADNFWEMGASGPCGPCTEIHYSHDPDKYGAEQVNKGLENLVELWNIVFVQYERREDGSIHNLSNYFVDTGMGLERVTAVLNGKISNYDTDLFTPLFEKLQQLSNRPGYAGKFGNRYELDKAYRILADHSRMIAISLCDDILPNDCYPLKDVIRKCMLIGNEQFGFSRDVDWLAQLCDCNVHILGEALSSLKKNIEHAKDILRFHENAQWNQIDIKETGIREWAELTEKYPKLPNASNVNNITISAVKKHLETFETLRTAGKALPTELGVKFALSSQTSKENFEIIMDAFDVSCDSNEVYLAALPAEAAEYNSTSETNPDTQVKLSPHLSTLSHLVHAALSVVVGRVYIRDDLQTGNRLNLKVLSFQEVTTEHIVRAEQLVRSWIIAGGEISRKCVPLRDAVTNEGCIIDYNKKYPLNVWVVSMATASPGDHGLNRVAVCDKAHVANISDLGDFTFDNIVYEENGIVVLSGICGNNAKEIQSKTVKVRQAVDEWKEMVNFRIERNLRMQERIPKWRKWHNNLQKKKMSAAFLLQMNAEICGLINQANEICCSPSNIEQVLEEGRNIINGHAGDGIYQAIDIDYRGSLPKLTSLFKGDEKFPIVFICKGWGKLGILVYVPQTLNISLPKMFEEIQLFYCASSSSVHIEGDTIGCLSFTGLKMTHFDKLPEILRISKAFCENIS